MIENIQQVGLEFAPSFIPLSKMEVRNEAGNWRMEIEIHFENGQHIKRWEMEMDGLGNVEKIVTLGRKVVTEAITDNRLILDGIGLSCSFTENQLAKSHQYRSPDRGTHEWHLAVAFMEMAELIFKGQELTNYIERLEGYFGGAPVKLFDENPRRLRIYGSLSVLDYEEFMVILDQVANEEALILDLTNLEGMGAIFYPKIEALKSIPKLEIWLSPDMERAQKQVWDMGFSEEQVVVIVGSGRY
ncbi:hypothetical protein [Chitinophaga caseinilytica]|uniref:hypothetical protein n=1 Tax=Chitinophaga caseinilytica TaxID=2267521 RepID=UPI003C2C030E